MPFEKVTLASLNEIDRGKIASAFAMQLDRAVQDCIDRPMDKKPRVVTIEATITPDVEAEDGIAKCVGTGMVLKFKSKIPTHQTTDYHFRVNTKGELLINTNNPTNPNQTTIDDIDPVTQKIKRA